MIGYDLLNKNYNEMKKKYGRMLVRDKINGIYVGSIENFVSGRMHVATINDIIVEILDVE